MKYQIKRLLFYKLNTISTSAVEPQVTVGRELIPGTNPTNADPKLVFTVSEYWFRVNWFPVYWFQVYWFGCVLVGWWFQVYWFGCTDLVVLVSGALVSGALVSGVLV